MKIKFTIAAILGIVIFILFGALFGSPLGVFGWAAEAIDFHLKTKIILALAIFGFGCISYILWRMLFATDILIEKADMHVKLILCVLISYYFAAAYQDCTIFTFCDKKFSVGEDCETSYDGKGVYVECR